MNKLALVFGGSRGIGAACVKALAQSGFDVAYTYVSTPPGDPTGKHAYPADITTPQEVMQAFDHVQHDFGRAPDCVVANAGINVPPAPLAQFKPEAFRQLVDVNLVGAFNILAEAARRVTDGGSIIALTTSLVRHAAPGLEIGRAHV